jgi:hypothetical protein
MALKWSTIEKAFQDPQLFLSVMNPETVKIAQQKIKLSMLPIKQVDAAQAETYTVEYDEFVAAVRAAGKVKIGGNIVENPSDADLLQVKHPVASARSRQSQEFPHIQPMQLSSQRFFTIRHDLNAAADTAAVAVAAAQAWRAEELRRALEREQKGQEPMTRAVRLPKASCPPPSHHLPSTNPHPPTHPLHPPHLPTPSPFQLTPPPAGNTPRRPNGA